MLTHPHGASVTVLCLSTPPPSALCYPKRGLWWGSRELLQRSRASLRSLVPWEKPVGPTSHSRMTEKKSKLFSCYLWAHCRVSSSCYLVLSGSRLYWRANRRTLRPHRASHTLQVPRAPTRVRGDFPIRNRKWEGSQHGGEGSQGIFLSFRAAKATQG